MLKKNPGVIEALKSQLLSEGYAKIHISQLSSSFDKRKLSEIKKSLISSCSKTPTEVNYSGTEKRRFGFQSDSKDTADFFEFSKKLYSALNLRGKPYDLLGIINEPLSEQNLIKDSVGRWHMDSVRNQYKIFLFLDDVSDWSGPLSIIPGSHKISSKIYLALRGQLFRLWPWARDFRKYRRLSYTGFESKEVKLTVKAGTLLLVNTSCIHRATPCLSVTRYALTVYI